MKKNFLAIIFTTATLLVLTACGGGGGGAPAAPPAGGGGGAAPPAAAEETIVFSFGHVLAPEHPYNLGAIRFREILMEISPVPVDVEIFHSAQLGNERDMTEGMQLGTIDMALAPGTMVLFEPRMGVFDLPYIFDDEAHAHRVLDGPIGDELASGLPSNGLRLLAYWENGFRNVTSSLRPINHPDDLAGKRIRLPENPIYQAAFENFGASVFAIPSAENYAALQQGVVDGQENPLVHIVTSRFYEVQDYLSVTAHTYGPAHLLISEATWQSLSPELQEAIQIAAIEARDYQRRIILEGIDEARAYLEQHLVVNDVDTAPFREASMVVWDMFRDDFGDLIDRIRAYAN